MPERCETSQAFLFIFFFCFRYVFVPFQFSQNQSYIIFFKKNLQKNTQKTCVFREILRIFAMSIQNNIYTYYIKST